MTGAETQAAGFFTPARDDPLHTFVGASPGTGVVFFFRFFSLRLFLSLAPSPQSQLTACLYLHRRQDCGCIGQRGWPRRVQGASLPHVRPRTPPAWRDSQALHVSNAGAVEMAGLSCQSRDRHKRHLPDTSPAVWIAPCSHVSALWAASSPCQISKGCCFGTGSSFRGFFRIVLCPRDSKRNQRSRVHIACIMYITLSRTIHV